MVEVAGQRSQSPRLIVDQTEAARGAHQGAVALFEHKRSNVTAVQNDFEMVCGGMSSASIEHIGRVIDALEGAVPLNERHQESSRADPELK